MTEYIITFKNTNYAIQAERRLLEAKLQVGVLPLPSQIGAGCGICLRVDQDEIEQAASLLADAAIVDCKVYRREKKDGQSYYSDFAAPS